MSKFVIRAEGIGKRYRTGMAHRRRGMHEIVERVARAALFRPRAPAAADDGYIWALRDVSFEIGKGEVVGVLGSNGAGKSVLLKILSRVTAPSRGGAEIRGHVGSLLEVGAGFHPELTGRENIFFNGAVLGMTRERIRRQFDEIVAFSQVERFVDTPVKLYSSGMRMRLAFSVAAHLEPDVLLIDEALSVGDAAFREKCRRKIAQFAAHGCTLLLVSHEAEVIGALCSRAIVLRGGTVVDDASAKDALARYGDGIGVHEGARGGNR